MFYARVQTEGSNEYTEIKIQCDSHGPKYKCPVSNEYSQSSTCSGEYVAQIGYPIGAILRLFYMAKASNN